MKKWRNIGGLAGWLSACLFAALIGAYFEPGSWYQMLNKPSWTPPNWVFPVVWPILYLCMAIAAWLIWKEYGFKSARKELRWFILQLALNAAWSWIFFGRQAISTALGEILLLWMAILFTTMLFRRKNKIAAYLMAPYLLWVSYAVALNFALWQMN